MPVFERAHVLIKMQSEYTNESAVFEEVARQKMETIHVMGSIQKIAWQKTEDSSISR